MIEDVDFAVFRLKELASLGIKISVDDFGTGYSSMSNLKSFPLHYMKIDKSFVDGLPKDKNNAAIVDAIISLGKSLNLEIIAEGVEHYSQYAYLKEKGCDIIQAYRFSKPMDEEQFLTLIKQFKSGEIDEQHYWQDRLA